MNTLTFADMRSWIPNALTLFNLLCGIIGIYLVFNDQLALAASMIYIGAFFDFFDGLVARAIGAQSAVGKELDSLSDLVTFGVLPGFIVFAFLKISLGDYFTTYQDVSIGVLAVCTLAFLIPLSASLRLARFNVDEDQSTYFKGLPTPAAAIFVSSLPLMYELQFSPMNFRAKITGELFDVTAKSLYWDAFDIAIYQAFQTPVVLISFTVLLVVLMNAPMRLIAFKFKGLSWESNEERYVLILAIVITLILAFIHSVVSLKYIPFLEWFALIIILFEYLLISFVYRKRMY